MNIVFCERLKKLRKAKKLTQKKLGEKLGLSDSIITMYELGKRDPSSEILLRIADLFNVSVDYLTGRTNDKNIEVIQTNFLDNEGKERKLELQYEKQSKDDTITLSELQELIKIINKLGIDLDRIKINK